MRRRWKVAIAAATLALLAGAWILVQPIAFLPHERIVIGVPYRESDRPTGMIPMGETLYHPKPAAPRGHPGIDFGWDGNGTHDIISSSDGVVVSLAYGASGPETWDVVVRTGVYHLVYKELEETSVAKGDRVVQGDLIGHPGHFCDDDPAHGPPHCWYNMHWELASMSPILDRFCPVTYLDPASRASLEELWASVPATDRVKSQFPDICSGDYAGRVG